MRGKFSQILKPKISFGQINKNNNENFFFKFYICNLCHLNRIEKFISQIVASFKEIKILFYI